MSKLGNTLLLVVFRQCWFSWHLEGSLVSDQSQKTQLSSDLDSWPTKSEIINIAVSHTHTHTKESHNIWVWNDHLDHQVQESHQSLSWGGAAGGSSKSMPSRLAPAVSIATQSPFMHCAFSQTRFHPTTLTKVKKSWKPLSYLRPLFHKQENQAQRSMLIKDSQTESSADHWELSNMRENGTLWKGNNSTNGRSLFGKVLKVITI